LQSSQIFDEGKSRKESRGILFWRISRDTKGHGVLPNPDGDTTYVAAGTAGDTDSYTFDDIESISIESRGVTGAVSGNVFLSVGYSTPRGTMTAKYNIQQTGAERILNSVEKMRQSLSAPEELRTQVLRLVKPKGEVSLHEVAKTPSLKPLIAKVTSGEPVSLTEQMLFERVKELVESLIADGELDGIVTDEEEYISNTMLARKTVQYQVVIDFASLHSELETKGIVLQTIDCPACGGKLDYPEDGSTMTCKYCDSTVSAVDIFEKFKSLL